MRRRLVLCILLALSCAAGAYAQDATTLAQNLVTIKGGYSGKKILLEEVRIRAYIPILLKAVGKGPAWKPGHPNWAATEQRIAEEWRKHYLDYLSRMGRDTSYRWMDDALVREYARVFNADELRVLLAFYRTAAGVTLLQLENEFLGFYPNEILRSLARVMLGTETLSARERELFRSPENRERRAFVELFESELFVHAESLRIGSPYVDANRPLVQQGALATGADNIDALRRKLDTATLAELHVFLKSDIGRKERVFVGAAVPTVTPAEEDPALAKREEAAFYNGLGQLSAQWRAFAAGSAAK
ncbi:MAG: DUF2059 domain-containing protein [Burkholderiales bacterium]